MDSLEKLHQTTDFSVPMIMNVFMQVRHLFHGTEEHAIEKIIKSNIAGFLPLLSVNFLVYVCLVCS